MTPFSIMLAELDRAAHDSAFGRNLLPTPSEAQCQAGNYRVGRVNIHGLPVSIEQPRDSVRCGTDASGKAWRSRMAAHYGYINGTTGADGDHVDCFIGDWPISNTVWVINQHINGKFDEHKVMLLFNREDMARAAYLDSYEPGWNGIGSMIKLTPTQLSFWLKSGDMSKPLTQDQLFNEGFHPMNTTDPTWDSGAHVARAWYDVERLATGMDVHELHEPLTVCDAIAGGQLLPRFDALVVTMGKAEAKLATMQSVLARNGGKLSVVGMQITDPFKQAGTTNIVAIYELSDGQTISIYLHNPDTTPNKLAPTDAMVAWKWLLNRRDVSVVVAPENGQELSPLTIGRRVMALAEKNSEAFVKANARRAEKLQALDALVGEVADLTTRKRQLENELASLDVEIVDAVAKKQARARASRAARQTSNQPAAQQEPAVNGVHSEQYNSYANWISSGREVSQGMREQIMTDDRLNDGEVEQLLAMADAKAVNAPAGDVQQPANGPEPEPVAALPNLVGNEKQVAWAKDIRSQVAINVERALKLSERDITDHGDDLPDAFFREVHELHKAQADKLMSNADAQFWIDSRVFALGAQLADSHPSSSDTPLTMLSNWDRADRAAIKALRAKYRAQQEAATAPEQTTGQTDQTTAAATADELLNKLASGYGYSAGVDAMPAGLMTTAKKLASAITSNDVKAAQDILHPNNKLSRKAFEFLFDGRVKLPNTVGGTDAVIKDFIDRVSDAAKAATQTEPAPAAAPTSDQDPQAAADRALFQSIIDGTAPDLLSPELAGSLKEAAKRRKDDPELKPLLGQALDVYQAAMLVSVANLS